MVETSHSLLERLGRQHDPAAWQRLLYLYTPLIRGWLHRQDVLQHADVDDLVQEVLCVVLRKLPEFQREPRTGAFRCWLRTITVNCVRDFWRAQRGRHLTTGKGEFLQMLEELEDPASNLSRLWDLEHDRHVARRLLELIAGDFEPTTWKAFQRVTQEGAAPADVANELGVSVNAVFIAKSRVLSRLRQEAAGLIDESRYRGLSFRRQ